MYKNVSCKPEDRESKQREDFLNALTLLLNSYELGQELLAKVEEICSFESGLNNLLFPGGISEILDEFMLMQDKMMLNKLELLPNKPRIRDKIQLALNIRVKESTPVVHKKIFAYLALPHNLKLGLKFAYRTCDLIWKYAGDKSTDFNFYTKRGLLFVVYMNSILFYISDKSEDTVETYAFIEDSLNNVLKLGKIKNLIKIENIPFLRLFL